MNCNLSLSQIVKFTGAILLALIMLPARRAESSIPPISTPFCACCADPGMWSLETRKIDDSTMKEFNRLKPAEAADFLTTAAWPDDVSGIAAPESLESGDLVVSIVREQRTWKFFFKTPKDEKGALVLTLPAAATFFNSDNEQRPTPENKSAVVLYKEVRLEGDVRGTGIFANGMAPRTRFRLVLQGKGNACLSADDFYRWNLRVTGPKARYTIYGFFAKPSP